MSFLQFAAFLLTLLVVQIAIASWVIVGLKEENAEKKINKRVQDSVNKYFTSSSDREIVNAIQVLVCTLRNR